MAFLKAGVALLLLNFVSQSQGAAPLRTKEALITYTVDQGNAVKTFSLAAYDTDDRPTVTTEVTIDNAPATVVIEPYKKVHMITPAPVVKRVPDDIGDHGEPDSDAPGQQPPSPPDCPGDQNAPIPDPTPIPNPPGNQGPPPPPPPSAPFISPSGTMAILQAWNPLDSRS